MFLAVVARMKRGPRLPADGRVNYFACGTFPTGKLMGSILGMASFNHRIRMSLW